MSAIRVLRHVSRSSARLLSTRTVASASFRQIPSLTVRGDATRAFSATARAFGEGTSDLALSQKLQEELNFEIQDADPKAVPDFLTEFKAQGIWTLQDTPLNDEVTLTRTFGNETIKLLFSIADIQNDPEEEFEDDAENEKSEGEARDEPVLHTFPIRVALTMTKNSTPAALTVDMVVQEGNFMIENVTYYKDGKTATELSAEADWLRRGIYMGPQFDSLDVGLQENLEQFLQERGINESVALFIPEYAEYKEQKEYVTWLNGVKKFIDA